MSSARFARSGRVRICILMSMFIVLIMMIVIYQMSQHQLDESRAFQEGLSVQMESLNAEKETAEKRMSLLRTEKLSLQEKYEGQLAEAMQKQQETERALQEKFDAQVEKYKLLELKHSDLEAECLKSKKKHIEDTNAFDQKLQKVLADVHKDKASKEHEVAVWKEKLDKLKRDGEHKIHALEATLAEFKTNCNYVPKVQPAEAPAHDHQQQLNKPAEQMPTTRHTNPAQLAHSIEKPRNEKSFDAQVQIVPKTLSEKQQQEEPQLSGGPVSPLSAPRKSSTQASKGVASAKNAGDAPNASVAPKVSSSGLPPLAVPPAKPERKLPENVAPIPDNFEDKADAKGDAGDVDTAAEEMPKNENNNRYANAVNDLESNKNLGVAPKPIEDSGAHEVKDALNEPSFNLPAAGQNFFDGELPAPGPGPVPDEPAKQMAEAAGAGGGAEGDDDDDVGDVAVKQPQHLLDTDNLNNEIVADQGKEFAEGIHLEDGMDEDQDEDDYSNGAARKKGGEVIRN
ncbi:actin cytoskeleton-regulatory complex protein pan1 isoform X3 [Drosophila elegans]|uniref:actin cytoskeleton-regulatory complex protein pan1 isoform X3 n=1 Tax=Drosophila elegans TaxID=30023 RepID=UPI0007E75595|nr:actin cytoskeleton-regulatory complex protein pan1 isoform X3 [Drosophila elegans]